MSKRAIGLAICAAAAGLAAVQAVARRDPSMVAPATLVAALFARRAGLPAPAERVGRSGLDRPGALR